jgi:hypothetical protein
LDGRAIELISEPDRKPRRGPILAEAGLKRRQAEFEREYSLLDAAPAPTGRAVEAFMSDLTMLCCVDHDVDDEAALETAATLFDYLRDYLDIKAELSHQDRV